MANVYFLKMRLTTLIVLNRNHKTLNSCFLTGLIHAAYLRVKGKPSQKHSKKRIYIFFTCCLFVFKTENSLVFPKQVTPGLCLFHQALLIGRG